MKKYVIPTLNMIIFFSLAIYTSIRDGKAYHLIWIIGVGLYFYRFIILNLRKNTNTVKVSAMNKAFSYLTMLVLDLTIYEVLTGDRISDEAGDYLAYSVLAVTLLIWLIDYYIRPCLIPQLKFWFRHYMK